jgi:Rrf2 family transcriptional regulator, iron-sulfur cluster assembly transcription factor
LSINKILTMLSNACKYAIRAMIYLASRQNEDVKVNIRDISAEVDSPEPFTAKIMQSLSKRGFVSSLKGPCGGFYLEKKQAETTLLEIVKAIDGTQVLDGCGLGLKTCSDAHPCPIHQEYSHVRQHFNDMLENNTIIGLAQAMHGSNSVLKNILTI